LRALPRAINLIHYRLSVSSRLNDLVLHGDFGTGLRLLSTHHPIVWVLILHVVLMHFLKLYLQVLFEVSALLFYQFKLRLELPRRRRLKLCLRTAVILVEIHGIVGMMMCANGAKAHAKIAIVSFAAKRVESPATHT
jgi:hypothetical protein